MDPNQRSHGSGRSYYVALGAHGKSPGLFGHTWLMVLQLTLEAMAHQRGRCAIASTSIELVIWLIMPMQRKHEVLARNATALSRAGCIVPI